MPKLHPRYPLGTTGMTISPIGLGCWQFSRGKGFAGRMWPVLDDATVDAVVGASLKNGVNWFDTAEAYGWGESERALTEALSRRGVIPGDVVIATKWWPVLRTSRSLRSSIQARLEALGGFGIDLYQIHNPAALATVRGQMRAMADLVNAGKIRSVGVSNFSASRMRKAHAALAGHGIRLASNQVRYSLLDRRIETNGLLRAAEELRITLIAYSPLAQGLLTGKYHDDPSAIRGKPGYRKFMGAFSARGLARSRPVVDALRQIGTAHGVHPAQVALNWTVTRHGERVVAIPGATRERHARLNAQAVAFSLTPAEIDLLDGLSAQFRKKSI